MSKINQEALMSAKSNSIGQTKKDKLIVKFKNIAKKTITFLLALCLAVAMCACGHYSKETETYVNHQYVDMYKFEEKSALEDIFAENGLDYRYANNEVEQYQDIIQYLNEDNMIIYYEAFGITETNKICKVLGYNDLNDFLIQKGYVDENGQPSMEALRAASDVYMTQAMTEKTR